MPEPTKNTDGSTTAPNTDAPVEYSADAPVRERGQDEFRRWPFAERVAGIIAERSDPSSLVIGLNGPWGDGKTSVLNFIEVALRDNPQVVCLRFNPWRFSDEATMLARFFSDLAEAVDRSLTTRSERVGDVLRRVSGVASLVPYGEAARVAGELLGAPQLDELRDRLEKTLREAGKRVVVLMDDIDRLDKAEIQTLFRLVKLSADFQYTAYLLAFDMDIVAAALQDRYSGADAGAGRAFLEKIVQVPLTLPQIPIRALRRYCFRGVDAALRSAQIQLEESEVRRFAQAFENGLQARLRTPRVAKRYANLLSFSLPLLRGEVNTVDLMLLEGMRSLYPRLYQLIAQRSDLFLSGVGSLYLGSRRDQDREAKSAVVRTTIEEALSGLSPEDRVEAISLVREMFPRLNEAFDNSFYSRESLSDWENAQRIASPKYFSRYFAYTVPEEQITDAAFRAFVASLEVSDLEIVAQGLQQLIPDLDETERVEALDDVLSGLRREALNLSETAARTLVDAIIICGSLFFTSGPQPLLGSLTSRAMRLLRDLLDRERDDSARVSRTRQVLQQIEPLPLATELYRVLRRADGGEGGDTSDDGAPAPRRFTQEETNDFGRVIMQRVRTLAQGEASLFDQFPKDARTLLMVWRLWGGARRNKCLLDRASPNFATVRSNAAARICKRHLFRFRRRPNRKR